jgi:hypothetical protein
LKLCGAVYLAALIPFYAGFYPFGNPLDKTGWTMVASAFLQIVVAIVITFLDVDINVWSRTNQPFLKAILGFFFLLFCAASAVALWWNKSASVDNDAAGRLLGSKYTPLIATGVVVGIIFSYVIYRFEKIVEMHPGYTTPCEAFLIVVILLQVLAGCVPENSPTPPGSNWPDWMTHAWFGCSVGLALVQYSAYHFMWQNSTETVRLLMGLYLQLFASGLGYLGGFLAMEQYKVRVAWPLYLVPLTLLVPTTTMYCRRRKLHAFLGLVFIRHRMRRGCLDLGVGCQRGDLVEVEEAIKASDAGIYPPEALSILEKRYLSSRSMVTQCIFFRQIPALVRFPRTSFPRTIGTRSIYTNSHMCQNTAHSTHTLSCFSLQKAQI